MFIVLEAVLLFVISRFPGKGESIMRSFFELIIFLSSRIPMCQQSCFEARHTTFSFRLEQ